MNHNKKVFPQDAGKEWSVHIAKRSRGCCKKYSVMSILMMMSRSEAKMILEKFGRSTLKTEIFFNNKTRKKPL
jgi:hypothetical protein